LANQSPIRCKRWQWQYSPAIAQGHGLCL